MPEGLGGKVAYVDVVVIHLVLHRGLPDVFLRRLGLQVLCKAINLSGDFVREIVGLLEFVSMDVSTIQRDVKLGLYFGRGSSSATEQVDENSPGSAIEAFRDVAHDRDACPSNLIFQAEIVRKRAVLRVPVYQIRQPASRLPAS